MVPEAAKGYLETLRELVRSAKSLPKRLEAVNLPTLTLAEADTKP